MIRSRFRALYGASVLNLLVLLLCFAIAGFAVVGWLQRPRDVTTVLEWFAAAIVLHDLVALPLYTLLDRIAFGWLVRSGRAAVRPGGGRGRTVLGAVNSTPYLRVPAILSGLLLVVFFPVIFGLGSQTELSASGIAEKGYLARWLIASGVLFGVSGIVWGVAVARGRGAAPPAPVPDPAGAAPDRAGTTPAPGSRPGGAVPPPAPRPEPEPEPGDPGTPRAHPRPPRDPATPAATPRPAPSTDEAAPRPTPDAESATTPGDDAPPPSPPG